MAVMLNGFRGDLVEQFAERRAMLHDRVAYGAVMDQSATDLCVYSLEDLVGTKEPEDLAHAEDQRQVNSCGGHGGTTAFERAYEIQTGVRKQFSRMFLYLRGKAEDGIRGDNGMTISGGVKCLKERGCCTEDTFPYPGRYVESIPSGADEEAALFKLGSSVDVQAQDDPNEYAQKFLGHNMGALYNGCAWTSSMANPVNGVIERWTTPGRDGGHAWAYVGLSERTDAKGRHYYWLANSHSVQWGRRGFAEMSPDAYLGMCRHNWTESFGLSKLVIPTAKKKVILWDFSS